MSDGALAPSLHDACDRWADRPAITFRGDTLTYAEVAERIGALTAGYRRLGIGLGGG